MRERGTLGTILVLAALALAAVLICGYHPGAQDDAVYLAAIKHQLNPSLYPHDAPFITLQMQATIFDWLIAASVRLTHLSVAVVCFCWHYLATAVLLFGCWRLSRHCFAEEHAQWGSVVAVAVLLALPVAGTALTLQDEYLHPRGIATALIVLAVNRVLERRAWQGFGILAAAFLLHPLMAAFGASFCVILFWRRPLTPNIGMLFLIPIDWVLEPTSEAWRAATATRNYVFLNRWTGDEWFEVFAPFLLLLWFASIGRRTRRPFLSHLSRRLMAFGVFQLVVALVLALPPAFDRAKPWQPMRYLHLLYLLMLMMAGGLAGKYLLRARVWRWLALFVPLALSMFLAERARFPATPQLELPGADSDNPWLQAFAWIRTNTPTDSYFALGDRYMARPGEDNHGFRALAERSALADTVKDPAVVTQVPRLAERWQREAEAQRGWEHFGAADFHRLNQQFGVNWVVLEQPAGEGLNCPYQNSRLRVCRVD